MPEITMGVGVPRAAFVRFPLGTPFGEPGQADVQRAILLDLLRLVWEAPGAGTVVKFPYRWRRGLPPGSG
jgi:D-proline reductase (dithiol) PrdB